MQLTRIFSLFFTAIVALSLIYTGSGCANIVPPSGGPRDTLAPQIIRVSPANETKHFNEKKITFGFDEYVELNDAYKNMVISPLPKIMPQVDRKLKTVTIRLKDSLEKNTTYVFNFKDVIKDLNEGNKAKDLLYVVTTGDYFDSLQLSGNIKMAKTAKADSTLTVMLHSNLEDSAVAKQRPMYIAKVDTSGDFLFRYLKPGTYRLYGLKDEGGSYLYTSPQQVFAFADSPVVVSTTPPEPIRLYAYAEEEDKEASEKEEPELNKKERRIKFQTNLQGNSQDLLEPFKITFPNALKTYNPEKMVLSTDSTFTPETTHKFTLDSTRHEITMNIPWKEGTLYNLVLAKDFATDSLDRGLLKPDTIRFTTKAVKDYGRAELTFNNLDTSLHPVLLISQGGNIKNSFPLTANILKIDLYNPGDYEISVLYDRNNNGKWDPGDFYNHIQPELIIPLDRKLNFKANWDLEPEINLKSPPAK